MHAVMAATIVMSVVVLPLSFVKFFTTVPGNPTIMARVFTFPALKLFRVGVRVHGELSWLEDTHKPCVYIVNHQSLVNYILMGPFFPNQTLVIFKKSIVYIPIFGQIFAALGNIMINRSKHTSAIASMRKAADKVWI